MADRLPPIQIGRIDPCEFWFGVDAGAHDLFSGDLYFVVANQDDPAAARKRIEEFLTSVVAGREVVLARMCRACGCTEDHACLVDGVPCHWVERDLCSACQGI